MDKSILDAYQQFFKMFPQQRFYEFGLSNIINIDPSAAVDEWKNLCKRIDNKSSDLYVRNFGKNGTGNDLLSQLYSNVFKLNINFDQSNNNKPTMILQRLTDRKKNINIFNYQVSHVFGRTKNVYCFTAPWNIVFIPKIIDPFTGHEAKGLYVDEFKKLFQTKIYNIYEKEINEFNTLMYKYRPAVEDWLNLAVDENDRYKYQKEFEEINLTTAST